MRRGNSRNEAGPNVWDVVTSLAHALSDARDQLVGLIDYDRGFQRGHGLETTHRGVGEGSDHAAMRCRGGGGCCGNDAPGHENARSVHRQRARGRVAFGNHAEYKPELFKSSCKPASTVINYSPPRMRGGCGKGVSISFVPNSCRKDCNCRSPAPAPAPYECRRHCIGNQYVAVLREEACQVRERRLERRCENSNAKPRWTRC